MKILAVDDDPVVLELLKQHAASWGKHELHTLDNPKQALARIETGEEYDCFLLDIVMPEMTGIELCAALRGVDGHARTPVIMLTAMSDKSFIDEAFAAGATDYITKPFEGIELRARIDLVDRVVETERRAKVAPYLLRGKDEDGVATLTRRCPIHEPIEIKDVDGVISPLALENYVTQLSRNALFGSSVFAFSIVGVANLHHRLSAFDFTALVTDVAEAISDCMKPNQYLMSYVGNGTFVCVTERGWTPDLAEFLDYIHTQIADMDLHSSDGVPIGVQLCSSSVIRLTWRGGARAIDALAEAHMSAETRASRIFRQQTDSRFWYESLMA